MEIEFRVEGIVKVVIEVVVEVVVEAYLFSSMQALTSRQSY